MPASNKAPVKNGGIHGVYKTILTVLTPGVDTTNNWNDTIWMWVMSLKSVGKTDISGKFKVTDRKLFPGLYDLPPMDLTGPSDYIIEPDFIHEKRIYIQLQVPDTYIYRKYVVDYVDGPNYFKLVWNPDNKQNPIGNFSKPNTTKNAGTSLKKVDRAIYGLKQNYPNPCN